MNAIIDYVNLTIDEKKNIVRILSSQIREAEYKKQIKIESEAYYDYIKCFNMKNKKII